MNTIKVKIGETEKSFRDLNEAKDYAETELKKVQSRMSQVKEEEKALKRTMKAIKVFLGINDEAAKGTESGTGEAPATK
jgi:prefoldin subunit 5